MLFHRKLFILITFRFTLHRLTLFIFMLLILTPLRFKQHRR